MKRKDKIVEKDDIKINESIENDEVSLHFEAEETFNLFANSHYSANELMHLIRLIELISSSRKLIPEFNDRINFYLKIMKIVFTERE